MKKEDMQLQMVRKFEEYVRGFNEAGIERERFLQWVDRFVLHDDVRKAHRYMMNKILKEAMVVQFAKRHFKNSEWSVLQTISPHQKEVIILRDCVRHFKLIWRNRPKPRRRGAE